MITEVCPSNHCKNNNLAIIANVTMKSDALIICGLMAVCSLQPQSISSKIRIWSA